MSTRPIGEILVELGEVQDRLLEVDAEDFARRADLSNRQDALRLEAKRARDGLPIDDMGTGQLEREIAHLEDELNRFLSTRPSASAASGGGGPGGGGIDPGMLHEMHRKMDSSFGFAAKQERIRALRVRLDELTGAGSDATPQSSSTRSRLIVLGGGVFVVAALAVLIAAVASRDSGPSATTAGPGPAAGDVLVPDRAMMVVTEGDRVMLFDNQGRALVELGNNSGAVELNHAASVAFGDRASGLVYLEQSGWQIRHWPDRGSVAQTVTGVGERGVDLFDVALVDGRPNVLAGLHLADGEDDWTMLALVDLETFDVFPVGSYGRGAGNSRRVITAASHAEERILVSVWHDDDWWFELYNLAGTDDERGLPYRTDRPGSRVAHGVLAPDATKMAYVNGGTLIVRDLTAGTDLGSWPLSSSFGRVERVDYNGTLVIVSFDDLSAPMLINTATDFITPLPGVGVATLIDR